MLQAAFEAQINRAALTFPVRDKLALLLVYQACLTSSLLILAITSPFLIIFGSLTHHFTLPFIVDLEAIATL